MSKLDQVILKYTTDNYGDLILAGEPSYDERTKIWEARLRSTYPRIIKDDKSNEVVVRFLELEDLGYIRYNDRFELIEATSDTDAEQHLVDRIDLWKKIAEQIVVSAAADVFTRIAEGTHVLNPLDQIIHELTNHKNGDIIIFESEIDNQARPDKIREYLRLLQDLEIVSKIENGYTYGNTYAMLADKVGNDTKRLRYDLLSYVIKEKYSTIRQVFGITQLEPFVHIANTYYWPSLEAGKLIHTTRSRLYQRYLRLYYWMSSWDFTKKLSDLVEQGALIEENEYLSGNQEKLDNMLALKEAALVSLSP